MIFVTTEPFGRQVILSATAWQHVQQAHPEFTHWAPIKETVEKPNTIGISAKNEAREIYYRLGALERYPNLYVAVVVGYEGEGGRIKTAHLADEVAKIRAGGFKYVSK